MLVKNCRIIIINLSFFESLIINRLRNKVFRIRLFDCRLFLIIYLLFWSLIRFWIIINILIKPIEEIILKIIFIFRLFFFILKNIYELFCPSCSLLPIFLYLSVLNLLTDSILFSLSLFSLF